MAASRSDRSLNPLARHRLPRHLAASEPRPPATASWERIRRDISPTGDAAEEPALLQRRRLPLATRGLGGLRISPRRWLVACLPSNGASRASRHELHRLHHPMRLASAARLLQPIRHATISQLRHPILHRCGPRDVSKQPLATFAVTRADHDARVQVEPRHLRCLSSGRAPREPRFVWRFVDASSLDLRVAPSCERSAKTPSERAVLHLVLARLRRHRVPGRPAALESPREPRNHSLEHTLQIVTHRRSRHDEDRVASIDRTPPYAVRCDDVNVHVQVQRSSETLNERDRSRFAQRPSRRRSVVGRFHGLHAASGCLRARGSRWRRGGASHGRRLRRCRTHAAPTQYRL